jgi:drug/metabolite transporter (DMT)-like permease
LARQRAILAIMSPPDGRQDGSVATGILLILVASLIFAFSDAAAKFVVGSLPPLEIHWIRSLVVLAVTLPVLLWRKGPGVFRTRHPILQTVRGLCIMAASLLFLTGLIYLPVADASAINFIWPVLITVFSVIMLKEKVGIRRALATLAGFIGMLVIIRPGSASFNWAAVFPLGAAVVWSVGSVLTRKMSADDAAETTILWSAIIALAISSLCLPFVYVRPTVAELGFCVLIGIGSAVAHAMVVFAYAKAQASVLAPYSYTQLVWAAGAGLIFFGTLPDGWTVAGAVIITASGIYTAHREHLRRQSAAR